MNTVCQTPEELADCFRLLLRSEILCEEGRCTEALESLDAIPVPYGGLPPVLAGRAAVLAEMGLFEQSLETCQRLMVCAPTPESRQLRDSIKERALRQCPTADTPDTLMRRGNVHLLSNEFTAAIEIYERVLQYSPNHRDALSNKGYSLAALEQTEAAAACYAHLLSLHPDDARQWFNLGNVLKDMNRFDAAITAYRQAIKGQPDFAEAHLEIVLCQFASGQFANNRSGEGWSGYEWRWKTRQLKPHYPKLDSPAWLGHGALHDKTVLLWAEQGLGDTLQFARFAPLVADRAARVILRVNTRLQALMRDLDPRIEVIDSEAPIPKHDRHCPLMSLPLALGCRAPWSPATGAYLTPDPARIADWATQLGPRTRRRIGLCWAGRQTAAGTRPRDIPLAQLAPLWQLDAEFISLQLNLPEDDVMARAQVPQLIDPSRKIADFSDTAAIIAQLDLVISVDSAVAHLAGALGRPCWLLLRHAAEWRWQSERSDTPWYPALRLFRQPSPGHWEAVVEAVAAAASRQETATTETRILPNNS